MLDDWFVQYHPNCADNFDRSGHWASQGNVHQNLLAQFMADTFINASAPKSSGREYFNLAWLKDQLNSALLTLPEHQQYLINNANSNNKSIANNVKVKLSIIDAVDIQATLLAFTVNSIVDAIVSTTSISSKVQIYLCGGGVHNQALVNQLGQQLMSETTGYKIDSLKNIDIDADALEAMAFAWLAFAFDHDLISNMPAVTGASRGCTLGCEFLP